MTDLPDRAPPNPGEILRKRALAELDLTQERLAEALGVSRHTTNQLINGRRGVTPDMALRLGRVLGTSPEMWLALQTRVDLHEARRKLGDKLSQLPQLREPRSFDDGSVAE